MGYGKILVVEDNPDILELVAYNLETEGYDVLRAMTGENGLAKVSSQKPDLLILDVMLPGINGLDVCRKLKQNEATRNMPILLLTAKSEDADIISGLEIGADDYITKPFSPKVLIARVRLALRRVSEEPSSAANENILQIHDIVLDTVRYGVTVEGSPVNMSATEFAILKHLMSNPGWVFSRNQIIDAVRGGNYPVTERSVDVQILGLRKKLGSQGVHVETVRGVGYRFRGAN
ncbi:MAG: response regulator [Spirochaetales bacterium]|nr:response regulator [Spirochaetales bacterium]